MLPRQHALGSSQTSPKLQELSSVDVEHILQSLTIIILLEQPLLLNRGVSTTFRTGLIFRCLVSMCQFLRSSPAHQLLAFRPSPHSFDHKISSCDPDVESWKTAWRPRAVRDWQVATCLAGSTPNSHPPIIAINRPRGEESTQHCTWVILGGFSCRFLTKQIAGAIWFPRLSAFSGPPGLLQPQSKGAKEGFLRKKCFTLSTKQPHKAG